MGVAIQRAGEWLECRGRWKKTLKKGTENNDLDSRLGLHHKSNGLHLNGVNQRGLKCVVDD